MDATKLAKNAPTSFQISLRIRQPSIDPAKISRVLKIQPEHTFRAGATLFALSGLRPRMPKLLAGCADPKCLDA